MGSHLCERLIKDGHDVICLDNYFTGTKENVKELWHNPKFEMIRHDVIKPYFAEVDQIYNLACPASPIHYQLNPIKTTKTSVLGIINMLGLAKDVKAKLLQASTSEVYGDPIINPQVESYWGNVNPIGERACYDEGKRVAECLCMDYYKSFGVPVKIIRIFNTYGPKMNINDGRVVSNFIVQALTNKDITIYGDGTQTRSFQYIDNLIEGMIRIMNNTPDKFTGPINLGNPNEMEISKLASLIIELIGSKSKIKLLPLPSDDPKQRKPDITLAKEVINYNPNVDIIQGLTKTIEYFDQILKDNEC